MENTNSLEPKSKSVVGWVFGGISLIPLVGVPFGIVAIIIGTINKIKGQIFLGIAGILLTVILYGSLFYYGFVAKTGVFPDLKVQLASQIINTDAGQIALYKQQHKGKLPTKISDLGPSTTNLFFPTDPWLKEIIYTPKSDGTFELRSSGPDKIPYTADDISQTF